MIDNATNINDLRIPPSNHLERLSGEQKGSRLMINIESAFRLKAQTISRM
ncbi:type II toxin-antitoxin system RelE/ParE family toxin [Lentilactobacillus diolivorans]